MTTTTPQSVQDASLLDQTMVDAFVAKAIADWGALASAALVMIGDRLGLYSALSAGSPLTAAELAARTGTQERYVREWLLNQAASGYVEYDPASGSYRFPPEHAAVLPDLIGGFQSFLAAVKAERRIADAFVQGGGMRWGEHDPDLFEGTERFFRPGYQRHLIAEWLPALDGAAAKLHDGALVADVGCGHGASTVLMAQAYPRSRFIGFDAHAQSIGRASRAAEESGVGDRTEFNVASASTFSAPATGFDLIAFFDSFHDLADPLAAAQRAHASLAPGGSVLLVEPMAGERPEENFTPVGRISTAASVLLCVPNALADAPTALGTVATEAQLRQVFSTAGFSQFQRVAQTPFNRVFEIRA